MDKKFEELMHYERTKKDISLKQLADIIEQDDNKYRISQGYLSRLEKGDYDNPSILNILKITETLSLNFTDVISSFGFHGLVQTENSLQSLDIEDIYKIIREKHILAPLEQDGGGIIEYENLDEKEKELIISLIDLILTIGVCTKECIPNNMATILKNIEEYRDIRMNKAMCGKEEGIKGTKYSVKFSNEAIRKMEKFKITREEVIIIIKRYINLLGNMGDEMAFLNEDGDVAVNFLISDNLVNVENILKIF